MITVYHVPRTRSLRIIWMLEEMGIDYEVKAIRFLEARNDPEFMAKSPGGYLPVMTDGDLTMIESGAMMEYLAARYGPTPLAPEPGDPSYPAYLQYFHFGEASLAAPLGIIAYCRFFAPEDQKENAGVEAARQIFRNRLPVVEKALERGGYMAGEAFTAADISVAYALGIGQLFNVAPEGYSPAVSAYLARVGERPAYQRAVAV